jgi:RNA binding exosome subunit
MEVQMAVFWVVARVVWYKFADVSEVLAALLKILMEAASTSETSVNIYETTQRKNSEDSHLHTRSRENLISRL